MFYYWGASQGAILFLVLLNTSRATLRGTALFLILGDLIWFSITYTLSRRRGKSARPR